MFPQVDAGSRAGVTAPTVSILAGTSVILSSADRARHLDMSNQIKRMLLGSMAASGIVAVTSLVDMILGFPYSGRLVLDVLFLISAGIIIYMAYEAYKEST